jgi:hypothetical protein
MVEEAATPVIGHGPGETMAGSEAILRWAIVGSIIGFVVIGGLFGVVTYAFGGGLAAALAVGLFTGLLGGPGFGGMMGFVVQYSKYNEHDIG